MSIDKISDLTMKDIRFLMAVRDINENPEEYEDTELGEAAANTTSIRKATSLSTGEVRHRLNEKSDVADEELGAVTLYKAPPTDGGLGPKSVELTQDGERLLRHALASREIGDHDPTDVATAERVSALEARIEDLERIVQSYPTRIEGHPMVQMHETLFRSLVGSSAAEYYGAEPFARDDFAKTVIERLREVNDD